MFSAVNHRARAACAKGPTWLSSRIAASELLLLRAMRHIATNAELRRAKLPLLRTTGALRHQFTRGGEFQEPACCPHAKPRGWRTTFKLAKPLKSSTSADHSLTYRWAGLSIACSGDNVRTANVLVCVLAIRPVCSWPFLLGRGGIYPSSRNPPRYQAYLRC